MLTGKTRLVTAKVIAAVSSSGRSEARRQTLGQHEQADQADRGSRAAPGPRTGCGECPRRASRAAPPGPRPGSGPGWAGRGRRRCRWGRSTGRWRASGRAAGVPKVSQSRTAHGAKTAAATAAGTAISTRRSRRVRRAAEAPALAEAPVRPQRPRQAIGAQARPSQTASLRVRAARPIRRPEAEQPAIERAFGRAGRQTRHQQAGAQSQGGEEGRGVGEHAVHHERAQEAAHQPRARSQRSCPSHRQAQFRGHVGAQAPRQGHHHGRGHDRHELRGPEPVRGARQIYRDRGQQAGQRQPHLEGRRAAPPAAASGSSTGRPSPGRAPRRGCGRRRRSRPCPPGRGS